MNIKLLKPNATIPTRGSEEAAGWDLYSTETVPIEPGETVKIDTGISIELPKNTFGGIFARSGIATKRGLRPSNCTGVIDSDYRGPLIVALHNDSKETQVIECGERIAQLIVMPYINVTMDIVDELTDTDRGATGFGDSGRF